MLELRRQEARGQPGGVASARQASRLAGAPLPCSTGDDVPSLWNELPPPRDCGLRRVLYLPITMPLSLRHMELKHNLSRLISPYARLGCKEQSMGPRIPNTFLYLVPLVLFFLISYPSSSGLCFPSPFVLSSSINPHPPTGERG